MLPENEESACIDDANVITVLCTEKVKFENIKKKYVCDPANPSFIMAEYVMDKDVRTSTRDWIGLFPRGWNDFLQNVAFEYIVGRASNEEERRWNVAVNLKFVKDDLYHPEFQLVFVNRDLQVLGASPYFRFYKCQADAEKACKFSGKNIKSEIQLFEKLQVSENPVKPFVQRSNKFPRMLYEYGDKEKNRFSHFPVQASYSDTALLKNKNSAYTAYCSNCERLPEILKLQHTLSQEIKNMAEAKRDMEDYIRVLENKLELSTAAQKKLRLVAEYEKKEKITFQAIASTVLRQFSEGRVLRVINGNIEPLYSQIYHSCATALTHAYHMHCPPYHQVWPGMRPVPFAEVKVVLQPIPPMYNLQYQRRPRNSTTSMLSRHLELKAIIGAQNEKLRMMASKIAQLQVVKKEEPMLVKVPAEDNKTKESFDLNNNS